MNKFTDKQKAMLVDVLSNDYTVFGVDLIEYMVVTIGIDKETAQVIKEARDKILEKKAA